VSALDRDMTAAGREARHVAGPTPAATPRLPLPAGDPVAVALGGLVHVLRRAVDSFRLSQGQPAMVWPDEEQTETLVSGSVGSEEEGPSEDEGSEPS
jgi:hypothetical protein